MISNLLSQKKIKAILQLLSVTLLAYKTATILPNMLTLSLSSWMRTVFSLTPSVVLILVIALWNPSQQTIHFKRPTPPSIHTILSKENLIFLPLCVILGLALFWIITHFPTFTITGFVILFGSMILMFVLGMVKPELGPAVFFCLYSFLMFAEARLSSGWYYLGFVSKLPEWLQNTLFSLENINIALLMFTIGFLIFLMSRRKQIGNTILDMPIILFLIWTSISVITANNFSYGLRSLFIKWVFPVTIYYATFLSIKRTNGIREIKLALVALLFLSCLLSIQNAALTNEVQLGHGVRAKIWTVIAGQMGAWTVLILPLAFSLLLKRKEPAYIRAFCLVGIIMAVIMAAWEMQRVVILDFIFMLTLSFLLYYHKWRWHLFLYAALGIIAFFSFDKIVELINLMRPSLLQSNPLAYSANLDRLYLLEKGWDILRDSPFLGIGPGGFQLLHIGLKTPEVSSHNMFLEVAIESGFIASAFFTAIVFIPIVKFAISFFKGIYRTHDHDLRPWVISLATYSCVHIMLHTNWKWGYGAAVFCLLGVVVGTMKKAERQAKKAITVRIEKKEGDISR
ncbi:MAG: O-antigen ligase family protein [Thermodesulfobacteriota bacterium]|nr:O-antigen ligase family protein [Thermodesulfobacteriota bacterium]